MAMYLLNTLILNYTILTFFWITKKTEKEVSEEFDDGEVYYKEPKKKYWEV
jgi:hypothetical protein